MNLPDLAIAEAGAKLRAGSISAIELTKAHLDRIEARNPIYRAFVTVTREQALADASRADDELRRGLDRGPFHGIPIALKDVIDTEGTRTTCGSRLHERHVPSADAKVVTGLKRAGAVILGKLATYEFALAGPSFDLPFPPAKNPWNLERITGGSSSGSAAAVAGGLVRTTLGTDTGGSVRGPACYCGAVGLKPTFGSVSQQGILPLSPSLDHVGPISATVAEAALTLDVIAGGAPAAASRLGTGIDGLRIAYARDWFAHDPAVMPEIVAAMDDAVSHLSLLGARIAEVPLPDYAVFEACGAVILHAEALAVHKDALRMRADDYGRLAFQSLVPGVCLTAADLAQAKRVARALRETLQTEIFSRFDALVTANALTTAPPFSAFAGTTAAWLPMRTLPFNVTGHPALALPAGHAGGLPLGLQIVGKPFEEAQVCRIGDAFETSTDHSVRRAFSGEAELHSTGAAGRA